jgi:tRNA threonylcarbamoyladenosine biosynthesis protein TsaB
MAHPMRGLALETSGRQGSVALVEDGRTIAHEQFPHGLQHAAKILVVIDSLCRAVGWLPHDLREVYVSIGPGSFTGLRVGVTLAKTLAMATGAKIIAVPSVRVLAHNAPAEAKEVIVVLDAKRGQIFTARFGRNAAEWIEQEPAHVDTLAAMLGRARRPVHLLGEGLPYHDKFVAEPGIIVTPPELWRARAEIVAELGYAIARRGEFADPLRITPLYVRLPEAEEKFQNGAALNPQKD